MRWVTLAGLLGAVLAASLPCAAAGADLAECAPRLEELRREAAALEPVYVARAFTPTVFARSSPNPAAHAALLPELEAVFAALGAGPQRPSLALECRVWACRMKVLQPAGTGTRVWEQALTTHPRLAARIRNADVSARRPLADPLTGEAMAEATVFLKLADPSGGPAGTSPPASQPRDPAPATAALCQAEIDQTQRRIATMKKLVARDLSPAERFAAEPANEALTREMSPLLRQALTTFPPVVHGARVSCRGMICEVALPAGTTFPRESWLALWHRPSLEPRVIGVAPSGSKGYLKVRAAQVLDGRVVLANLVAAINRQPFLDDCHTRHPGSGHLLVRYVLPRCDRDIRTAAEGIKLEYSGSLVDTPLGKCVVDELGRAVAAAPLPAQVMGAYHDERYDWPRGMTFRRQPPTAPPAPAK